MNALLIVILRWLHIIPAAIAIGGLIFMRFVLPAATRSLNEEQSREVFLRGRRVFKIMLHASILFLIISGVINSIRYYPQYVQHRPLAMALWHTHMFLAVIVFVISFWSLAGKVPPDVGQALRVSEGARVFYRSAVDLRLTEDDWRHLLAEARRRKGLG